MKRVILIILTILSIFIGINKVYAIDEYVIHIYENGTTELKDGKQDPDSSATINNDGIYSFENDVLTLNENYHYLLITVHRSITSNNKKVYLNLMYTAHENTDVTYDNLVSESYETESTQSWLTEDGTDNSPILVSHMCASNFTIKNSNIKVMNGNGDEDGMIHTKGTHNTEGALIIENSTVYTTNVIRSINGITIKNSRVKSRGIQDGENFPSNVLIENSNIDDILPELDEVISELYGSLNGNLTIKNSTLIAKASLAGRTIEIDNSTIHPSEMNLSTMILINADRLTIKNNSDVEILGCIIAPIFTIKDSKFKNKVLGDQAYINQFGYDNSALSAIFTKDLTISNSTITSSSKDVPALLVFDSVTVEPDSFVFIDDELRPLELTKVNLTDYNIMNNPNNYFISNAVMIAQINSQVQTPYTQVYTLLLNDEPIYSYSSSELIEYTLKIKNGTWEDGTTDDKVVTVLKSTNITKDYIVTKPTKSGDKLILTKTGSNEYTYEYVDEKEIINPKTGVKDFVLLLIISLLGALVISYNKNKLSLFKNV